MFKISLPLMIFTLLLPCETARILGMFSVPIISHQRVFRTLTEELAKRGHEVTVIAGLSTKDPAPENYREYDLSYKVLIEKDTLVIEDINPNDMYSQFKATLKVTFNIINGILDSKEVKNLIMDKNEKFDLILIEDCARAGIILSHIYKAPVILISSFGGSYGTFEIMGGAVHPIVYPLATRKKFQNLSFHEKILEILSHYKLYKTFREHEEKQNEINRNRYGPDTPTLDELQKNVQMLFLNIHSVWDSNRPVPPNVIYLGGLHTVPIKELPKDLESSLNASVNGAIYVSFGSVVDPIIFSSQKIQMFINVFSRLPYDVYWKCNSTEVSGLPKNIKVYDWFPQSDLLRHKNIKLFITHGGLQSTDEAIAAEVPLVGIPICWDQFFNVDKYVQLKIGVGLDIETINEEKLENAINTVMDDETYRNNIIKLHSRMIDSPQSSLDRAVFWTEYVLRHGADHLKSPSMTMSWLEYYEVDIVFVITAILLSLISIGIFVIIKIIRFVRKYFRKIKRE